MGRAMERARDKYDERDGGIAARDGDDDVDSWMNYVMSEGDAAALDAMVRLPDQQGGDECPTPLAPQAVACSFWSLMSGGCHE